MTHAIDPGAAHRKARAKRLRIRTTPPALWLVGGGPASNDGPLAPDALIALAQAARRTAADCAAVEPAEPGQGRARIIPEG